MDTSIKKERNGEVIMKEVSIKIPSGALGDNIAWFPYFEVFRKKHKVKVNALVAHYKLFEDTYFKEVYDTLLKKYKLGRVRVLWKLPRTTLSWHRDPEPRLHIPIITNPGAIMVVDKEARHMPADGSVWVVDNTKYHNFFNGGEEDRIHFVATIIKQH